MKIDITFQQLELDKNLSGQVLRRLQFALSKFRHSIRQVQVHFSDLKRSKGENEKKCSIKVKLTSSGEIMVQGVGKDIATALSYCVERISRAVKLNLERSREVPVRTNRRLKRNKELKSPEDNRFSPTATRFTKTKTKTNPLF